MHPYTQDRLAQDREYEAALRADIEREEREAMEMAIVNSLTDMTNNEEVTEEALREEEERPLTIEELRALRVAYYEPNIQCEALTLAGTRCKRAKQGLYSKFCRVHSKKIKQK